MRRCFGFSWTEMALALRRLRKEPAFAGFAVALLGLAIGLVSSVFTLLWQTIYAQLPVPAPAGIFTFSSNVTHYGRSESDAIAQSFSVPTYLYLARNLRTPLGTIARHGEMVNVETPAGPQHLPADFVTGNFFEILDVNAAIGRLLRASDDAPSAEPPVVLSYDMWQRAYAGEVTAWNSILRVNGLPFRVIGVAPREFGGLVGGHAPQIYLPLSAYAGVNPGWESTDDWAVRWLNVFIRLPAGVSRTTAEAELQPVYRAAVQQELASQKAQSPEYLAELSHEHMSVVPASRGVHSMLDQWSEPLRILQWMTAVVLILAGANVAGLMLVRSIRERQHTLIRYALGATRYDVMRLQFAQALIISIAGGALALWIARSAIRILIHLARMGQINASSYAPHPLLLAMHWAVAFGTGLAIAILPAWQAARLDLAAGLNEAALTHSSRRAQGLTRRAIAGAQIALSLVTAMAAAIFARDLYLLIHVPMGFDAQHLTVFSMDAKLAGATPDTTRLLWTKIASRLQHAPGVQSVSYGTGGPFPQGVDAAVLIRGTTASERGQHQSGVRSIIGPRYFATLHIPTLAGRQFEQWDDTTAPDVVMVNETMARKLFGATNPVGQRVTIFDGLDANRLATVVGVVADYRQSWRRSNASLLYTPAQQARRVSDMTYYVRTSDASLSEKTIQEIVRQVAPGLGSYDIATMRSRMAEFASANRAMTVLIGAFAGLALVIAMVGTYGVVSYSTSLRTVEFGIRMAVGAAPRDILILVVREGLLILVYGLMAAIPLTWLAVPILRHELASVPLREPVLYAGPFILLALCTALAALIPARRAKRTNVQNALKHA